jgi:hypothetical protein
MAGRGEDKSCALMCVKKGKFVFTDQDGTVNLTFSRKGTSQVRMDSTTFRDSIINYFMARSE